MENFKVINTYFHQYDADIAYGILESNNIEAIIKADNLGGFREHLTLGMGNIKLLVRESDFNKAKQLLSVVENPIELKEKSNKATLSTKRFFLRAYLWILIAIEIIAYIRSGWDSSYLFERVFNLISFIAVYGLAYRKRFFNVIFWKTYFIVFCISFFYSIWQYLSWLSSEGMITDVSRLVALIFGCIFYAPVFISIYIYPSKLKSYK